MCPLLETTFLKNFFYLLNSDNVQSGFGLDIIWSHMNNYNNMAIIDYISVIHMRPVGHFSKKKTSLEERFLSLTQINKNETPTD